MKIINKNAYKVMFGMNFIAPNEAIEVDDKTAKILLNQPNIEKYVDLEDVDKLAKENAELKKKLEAAKKTTKKNAK